MPAEIGKASGAFNLFRFLSREFGIAVIAAVFAHTGGIHSPQAFNTGLPRKLGVFAALSLMAAIARTWQPTPRETALAPVGVKP